MESTGQPNQGTGAPQERLQQQNEYGHMQQVGYSGGERTGQGGYSSDDEQQQVNTENEQMHNERGLEQLNTEEEQRVNPNETPGAPDENAGQPDTNPGGL